MITRVRIKNFGSIADVDVKLGQLTVLVGKNGSGKSTFLEALSFLRDAVKPGVGLEVAIVSRKGLRFISHQTSDQKFHDIEIEVTIEGNGFWAEYGFVLSGDVTNVEMSSEDPDGMIFETYKSIVRIKREFCRIGKSEDQAGVAFEIADGKQISAPLKSSGTDNIKHFTLRTGRMQLILPVLSLLNPELSRLVDHLASSMFYTISPNAIGGLQSDLPNFELFEQGNNLASVLVRLFKRQSKHRLLSVLGAVIDDLADIKVEPIGNYLVVKVLHKTAEKEVWLDLSQESDGTKRLLFLLVALYQGGLLELLAIEEPELALHPGALGILSEVLREASLRHQILITTQSPDLISQFSPNELRVVTRIEGATRISPLEDRQIDAINEELFSAGDLLRIEGLRPADEMADAANA